MALWGLGTEMAVSRGFAHAPTKVLYGRDDSRVLPQSSLAAAHAIVVIAALSFLGVGVSPPNPSWGSMIQAGARLMTSGHWWVVGFPGLAVLVAVASFNLVADGLQMRQENER